MNTEVWSAIVDTHRRAVTLLDRAAPTTAEGVEPAPLGAETLILLSDALDGYLDELQLTLASLVDVNEGDEALAALAVHLDERTLARLSLADAVQFSLLQERRLARRDGGDYFYAIADRAMHLKRPPTLVVEVLCFCLRDGFVGRYGQDLLARDRYEQRLRALLAPTPAATPSAAPDPGAHTTIEKERSIWGIYVAAAAIVIALYAMMVWASNHVQVASSDVKHGCSHVA